MCNVPTTISFFIDLITQCAFHCSWFAILNSKHSFVFHHRLSKTEVKLEDATEKFGQKKKKVFADDDDDDMDFVAEDNDDDEDFVVNKKKGRC